MFVSVVVDIKSNEVDNTYTYKIDDAYENVNLVGCRVLVEFGAQKVLGFILSLTQDTNFKGHIKEVIDIIDIVPEITLEQIELAKYISDNTMCTLTQALQIMVPSFLRKKARKFINVIDYDSINPDLALTFSGKKKVLFTKELMPIFPKIRREIERGNIEISYDTFQYGKTKKIRQYYINNDYDRKFISSLKRREVVDYLSIHPNSVMQDILDNVNCTEFVVQALENNKVIGHQEIDKVRNITVQEPSIKQVNFTFVQEQVFLKYKETANKPYLLTTNNQTFKYSFLAQAITLTLQACQKVLIICPTILTFFETYNHLKAYLSDHSIASITSKSSNNDFYENYISIKQGLVDIVITTKVGLFLPLSNIGLCIMIDEDNYNYLNEQTPKYDAKAIILKRAQFYNAKMIYVSSSPSFISYHNCVQGDYYLLSFFEKTNNNVSNIDIRSTHVENGLSDEIISAIKDTLQRKKKAIIILNRRGYSQNVICRHCHEVIKCPKCNIPLTFYKEKNTLKCNYCDYKVENYQICPKCASKDIMYLGVGIEQIMERLSIMFPSLRILQIDSEILQNQKVYDDTMVSLEDDNYDLVVGTSIAIPIANSINIDLISLLDVDGILNYSDYRMREDCFNLITKVLNFNNKHVIVQGYNINNDVIKYALINDYQSFYEKELSYRRLFKFPPFFECNRLIVTGDYKDMYYYANYFKKVFNNIFEGEREILGPVYLYRQKGVQLVIKHNNFQKLKKLINEVNNKFEKSKIQVNFERFPRKFS